MAYGTLKVSFLDTGTILVPVEDLQPASALHPVAFSGDYTALLNRPTLGTAAALNAAAIGSPATSPELVRGSDPRLTDSRTPTAHNHTPTDVTGFTAAAAAAAPVQSVAGRTGSITLSLNDISGLHPVAGSGSYADLANKPALSSVALSGSYGDLTGRPTFAAVALSGSYTDLTGRPTLGTASSLSAAELRDRATHTGTQAISTVSGLQDALDAKQPTGSYATLDLAGKVPALQLPSYVDDVLEFPNLTSLPTPGEAGKIYVTLDQGRTYRWSGTTYAEISPSPGSTDAVLEGSVNLYFSVPRARQSISAGGSLAYDPATGIVSYTAPTLASVALSGAYADLTGKPVLGTAAAAATTDFATAAQGALAATAIQPSDSRLTDARQPLAHTQAASTISDSTPAGRTLLTALDETAQRTALGFNHLTPAITVTVAPNASVQGTLSASEIFILYSISVTSAAWVVLYNSAAAYTADVASQRPSTVDATPGSGVCAEILTEGAATVDLSPVATIVSDESPRTTSYPFRVTNLGSASSITVTFRLFRLGA